MAGPGDTAILSPEEQFRKAISLYGLRLIDDQQARGDCPRCGEASGDSLVLSLAGDDLGRRRVLFYCHRGCSQRSLLSRLRADGIWASAEALAAKRERWFARKASLLAIEQLRRRVKRVQWTVPGHRVVYLARLEIAARARSLEHTASERQLAQMTAVSTMTVSRSNLSLEVAGLLERVAAPASIAQAIELSAGPAAKNFRGDVLKHLTPRWKLVVPDDMPSLGGELLYPDLAKYGRDFTDTFDSASISTLIDYLVSLIRRDRGVVSILKEEDEKYIVVALPPHLSRLLAALDTKQPRRVRELAMIVGVSPWQIHRTLKPLCLAGLALPQADGYIAFDGPLEQARGLKELWLLLRFSRDYRSDREQFHRYLIDHAGRAAHKDDPV